MMTRLRVDGIGAGGVNPYRSPARTCSRSVYRPVPARGANRVPSDRADIRIARINIDPAPYPVDRAGITRGVKSKSTNCISLNA